MSVELSDVRDRKSEASIGHYYVDSFFLVGDTKVAHMPDVCLYFDERTTITEFTNRKRHTEKCVTNYFRHTLSRVNVKRHES